MSECLVLEVLVVNFPKFDRNLVSLKKHTNEHLVAIFLRSDPKHSNSKKINQQIPLSCLICNVQIATKTRNSDSFRILEFQFTLLQYFTYSNLNERDQCNPENKLNRNLSLKQYIVNVSIASRNKVNIHLFSVLKCQNKSSKNR